MKQKYTVEIAGNNFNLISDESEEYIIELAKILSKKINGMVVSNKRCTKIEAITITALDYLDDKMKTKIKLEDLQSQIMDYADEAQKLRRENADLRRQLGKGIDDDKN